MSNSYYEKLSFPEFLEFILLMLQNLKQKEEINAASFHFILQRSLGKRFAWYGQSWVPGKLM